MDKSIYSHIGVSNEVSLFLKKFCNNFEKELTRVSDFLKENPLIYREKKISSLIFPALLESSEVVVMEHEFKIKNKNRFLDFYIAEKDFERVYLAELKHGYEAYSRDIIKQGTINKWEELLSQIKDLNKKNVNNYIDSENKKYKLAIFVLPSFISSDNKDVLSKILDKRDTAKNYQNRIKECFEGSNWWYTIKVNSDLNKISIENSKEVFPFVTLLGKVEEL